MQVLYLAPGVGHLQQGLLAGGVDLQVLELQEAVQAAVLRHAAGQGGFAGLGPLVLVDADAALAGDAEALQLAMGAVGVVQCAAVGQGQAGGFAARAVYRLYLVRIRARREEMFLLYWTKLRPTALGQIVQIPVILSRYILAKIKEEFWRRRWPSNY